MELDHKDEMGLPILYVRGVTMRDGLFNYRVYRHEEEIVSEADPFGDLFGDIYQIVRQEMYCEIGMVE